MIAMQFETTDQSRLITSLMSSFHSNRRDTHQKRWSDGLAKSRKTVTQISALFSSHHMLRKISSWCYVIGSHAVSIRFMLLQLNNTAFWEQFVNFVAACKASSLQGKNVQWLHVRKNHQSFTHSETRLKGYIWKFVIFTEVHSKCDQRVSKDTRFAISSKKYRYINVIKKL